MTQIETNNTNDIKKGICNQVKNGELDRLNMIKMRRQKFNELKIMEGSGITDTINNEIDISMKRKSWKTMDKCFKWIYVQEYLKDKDISENDFKNIKKLLQNDKLNVDYNKSEHNIKSIDYTTENEQKI
jgi:hypothetical protein